MKEKKELWENLIKGLNHPLLSKELFGRSVKISVNKIKKEFLKNKKLEDKKREWYGIKDIKKKQLLGNKRKDEIFKRNKEKLMYKYKEWKYKNLTVLERALQEMSGVNDSKLEEYWEKENRLIREYNYVVSRIWKERYKRSLRNFIKYKKIK
jgi:hypothetical protein